MFTAPKASIPAYLRGSELFCSLGDENDVREDNSADIISIPIQYCKLNEEIHSQEDLVHLCNTLRYWGVPGISYSILRSCFSGVNLDWKSIETEFGAELTYLKGLDVVRQQSEVRILEFAIYYCDFEVVKYLVEQGYLVRQDMCSVAAKAGKADCLEYFHCRGCPLPARCGAFACAGGSVKCLEYLFKASFKFTGLDSIEAAKKGNVDCLRYMLQKGKKNKKCVAEAARYGHVNCLSVLQEYGVSGTDLAVWVASTYGQIECVDFLHRQGCKINLKLAAAYGNLGYLKYAHEHGIPWDVEAPIAAAKGGHLGCLQYMHENGCPWNTQTTLAAERAGELTCLKYALDHGCPYDKDKVPL